jgi:hypothetical protein
LGQARNDPFGPIIYDKSKVEERIRRAQLAILNPKVAPASFLEDAAGDRTGVESQLSFSLNAVTLQISGPDVADLSFCDLPGVFCRLVFRDGTGPEYNILFYLRWIRRFDR